MLLNEHAANTAFKTNLEFSHTHFFVIFYDLTYSKTMHVEEKKILLL